MASPHGRPRCSRGCTATAGRRSRSATRRSGCRSAAGIGGTTLVNSGTCFRTPPRVLDRWRDEFGLQLDEDAMRPYFERVERALSVSEVTPELAGRNAAVARRGAERLGWSHGYLRRNARGCVGSGVCAFGCPTSAKQHTGITYIPRARAAGAQVLTGADVRRVVVRQRPRRGRAAGRRPHRASADRDRRRRHDPHAAAARAERPRQGLRPARPEPVTSPRDGGDRTDAGDRRHGPGRSAELLHRRVRGRRDHLRGHSRTAFVCRRSRCRSPARGTRR